MAHHRLINRKGRYVTSKRKLISKETSKNMQTRKIFKKDFRRLLKKVQDTEHSDHRFSTQAIMELKSCNC